MFITISLIKPAAKLFSSNSQGLDSPLLPPDSVRRQDSGDRGHHLFINTYYCRLHWRKVIFKIKIKNQNFHILKKKKTIYFFFNSNFSFFLELWLFWYFLFDIFGFVMDVLDQKGLLNKTNKQPITKLEFWAGKVVAFIISAK